MDRVEKLTQERRSKLAAERKLELKQAELNAAQKKLGMHTRELTERIAKTRAVVDTIRDENQRFRSDLTAANEKIAVTERRLWHSMQTIKDGFAFFDEDNRMIMANEAYLAPFEGLEDIRPGVQYGDILAALTDEGIIRLGEHSPQSWRKMMLNRLEQPQPEPTVIQLWNGTHVKLVDQRGPGGDMVSLGLDITETVLQEQRLQEARLSAEAANRAKSSFLANMSHEIRTPLNGVVGMADVLAETTLNEEQQLYVDTIKNSGEALLLIINDVLDFSKIEAGKLDLQPIPFDLEQAALEVLMLLQPSSREKGIALLLDYEITMPTRIVGDPGRIRQVLTNLVGNAVKFTNSGHVTLRISSAPGAHSTLDHVTFEVEDTGIGIPEDKLRAIFEEFNQVENERNRQFDGTGLGLAITKSLVGMMGGQIDVHSEEGIGSTFGFTMSLPPAPDAPALPELPHDLRHILIHDPLDASAAILKRQMERLGLKATRCDSAHDVIANCEQSVDAILFRHAAHETDGTRLAQMLTEAGLGTPLILLDSPLDDGELVETHDNIAAVLGLNWSRQTLLGHLASLAPSEDQPQGTPTLRPMRILAAEDNRTNQLVFRKMIKALDVELTFAANGEEAVKLYSQIVPDVVFMDISMPKMDGKDATRAIRKLEKIKGTRVPIIALTAHAMAGTDTEVMEAGLDYCLNKPLRKPDIMEQISAVHTDQMRPLLPPEEEDQLAG